ncbi:hypothetical protein Hanom_Chr03g00201251 [Helianthus anomalus]
MFFKINGKDQPSFLPRQKSDPDNDRLRPCFPDGTIFRPFDSSTKSDCISDTWITFLATLFLIGFTYPFPVLTKGFFTLTGLCYIQAMPMVWRILYKLEHIVEQEGIDIRMSELSQLYNLVSHGSYRYLFKSKPEQPHPILKATKNDTNWRNQFFFTRRDSIPNGNQLPKKWNTDVITLSHIQVSPATEERIKAFWKLDPAIRTFPPKSTGSRGNFICLPHYVN